MSRASKVGEKLEAGDKEDLEENKLENIVEENIAEDRCEKNKCSGGICSHFNTGLDHIFRFDQEEITFFENAFNEGITDFRCFHCNDNELALMQNKVQEILLQEDS